MDLSKENIYNIPEIDMTQRMQLSSMIKQNNIEDQTDLIRTLKHSDILFEESQKIINILKNYESPLSENLEKARMECAIEANFLFVYYTDIFNKFLKSEINTKIFNTFLKILKNIEEEKITQHEASIQVGTILKELYIDSALKKSNKLDEQYASVDNSTERKLMDISWKNFKQFSQNKVKY